MHIAYLFTMALFSSGLISCATNNILFAFNMEGGIVRKPKSNILSLIFRFSSIDECELQCRVEDPQPRALDDTLDSLGKTVNTYSN